MNAASPHPLVFTPDRERKALRKSAAGVAACLLSHAVRPHPSTLKLQGAQGAAQEDGALPWLISVHVNTYLLCLSIKSIPNRERKALRKKMGLEEDEEAEVEDPGGGTSCTLPFSTICTHR